MIENTIEVETENEVGTVIEATIIEETLTAMKEEIEIGSVIIGRMIVIAAALLTQARRLLAQ